MSLEKYDQWILLPVIVIVALLLIEKMPFVTFMIAGFAIGMLGLLLFNKGDKETVNLRTDISYIALAFILLIMGFWYVLLVSPDITMIVIILILLSLIAILSR